MGLFHQALLRQLSGRIAFRFRAPSPSSASQIRPRGCHSSVEPPPSVELDVLSRFSSLSLNPLLPSRTAFSSLDCSQDLRACAPFLSGSMQLMAVPKRKVSPSRKGKRNGPKALKPHPIIVKCKSCGRVKLPHFYCCIDEKKIR